MSERHIFDPGFLRREVGIWTDLAEEIDDHRKRLGDVDHRSAPIGRLSEHLDAVVTALVDLREDTARSIGAVGQEMADLATDLEATAARYRDAEDAAEAQVREELP